jgi:anthranilate synthase component 1
VSRVYEKKLVVDGITPVGAYAAFREDSGRGSFLLESVVPGERWGRYSILGFRPEREIVLDAEPGVNPFARLAELVPPSPDAGSMGERFARAHVGVVTYDTIHQSSKVEPWPGQKGPLVRLLGGSTVVVFDNLTHTASIASLNPTEVERAEALLARVPPLEPLANPDPSRVPTDVESDASDEEYGRGVSRIKEHILAGDAFQVVLARTFFVPAKNRDPFDVYRALRVLSPAPYMYLLELPATDAAPAISIAGASPETLVRVDGNRVTLRPIAGTRPRGKSEAEDAALAQEMLADPKERAEHVMLIDLARNDLGRVSQSGSISLAKNMIVERFSHVMHIVSEVTGELRPEMGAWDVLGATFPAGTLSGAPKVRAMQIIRSLESRPRGIYGGAVGYVTGPRDLDFAIAIRTAVKIGDRYEIRAGAGIVADSVPALEAEETRNKARAALAAVFAAERTQTG